MLKAILIAVALLFWLVMMIVTFELLVGFTFFMLCVSFSGLILGLAWWVAIVVNEVTS